MSESIRRRRRPQASTVIAGVALFAALGGSATAATLISGKDIKNASITGKDVKNRSLGTKELTKSTVKSLRGKAGPQGAKGATGNTGPAGTPGTAGAPGAPGATNVVVRTASTDVNNNTTGILNADCNPGEKATGGGFRTLNATGFQTFNSRPNPLTAGATPTGWHVEARNTTGAEAALDAFVVCSSP